MRKIRGVKKLVEYLLLVNCPISEATIYRLVRTKNIPFHRPTERVLLFDLNEIDKWLSGEGVTK